MGKRDKKEGAEPSQVDKVAAICIERRKIDELKPHPRNPRKHPEPGSSMWEVMRRSLESDYFDPVVWNRSNGYLVSGHLRVKVLQDLGFRELDVSVVEYDDPTHYARLIAANRPLGEFEEGILASLASDIELAGLDSALAGYDHKTLMAMVEMPEVDEDMESAEELVLKADELQAQWQVSLGDIYQIGNHLLMCGDCALQQTWDSLLQGKKVDMIWIDPPYNVAYDGLRTSNLDTKGDQTQTILNDDMSDEEYDQVLQSWSAMAFQLTKPGGPIYVAHAEGYGASVRSAFKKAGWYIAQCLVWVKNTATLGRQDYQWQHEPILYGWKPGAGHFWQGGYCQKTVIDDEVNLSKLSKQELVAIINDQRNALDTTVIREPKGKSEGLHPTVKPVSIVARQIWNSSKRGDTIVDFFGGSGTTMVAAEQIGRRAIVTELDPKYCAVILERMQEIGLSIQKIH